MNLFQEYNYIPYKKNKKKFIDNHLSKEDYQMLYHDFEKCIDSINEKIENLFFKNKFNYASKKFVIIEPHIAAFNLFTKSLILEKILIENKNNEDIVIEIYDEELPEILLDRFTNQYALIAQKIGYPFRIVNKGKINITYENNPSTRNKVLNLLNFNYELIIYELIKRFFKNLNNKKILKIGQNYISREIELDLYKKGIGVMSKKIELKNYFNNELKKDFKSFDHYKTIYEIVKVNSILLNKNYFSNIKIYEAYISVLTEIINCNVVDLLSKKEAMREKIAKYKNELNYNICLSNGLFGVFGKSVYDALSFNGIKVFSAEHGLTAGNSKDAIQYFYANESLTADILFCYSNASKKIRLKNRNSNLSLHVTGGPYFPKKIRFKKMKRFLIKKRLKIKGLSVFYVSHNIELNIGKYFPITKSDPDIFKDELAILSVLGMINKNVIYKPYPTKQYFFDRASVIEKHLRRYKNIRAFHGEEDFRYIRAASDIIITQSSESTLEWCIGVDVPLIFLDSDYYEPLENEKVKKAFKESFFVFNYDNYGWEKKLISFLNLPYKEIIKRWDEKDVYRKKYDEEYFLSSKKNAGEIGSKFILDLIDG